MGILLHVDNHCKAYLAKYSILSHTGPSCAAGFSTVRVIISTAVGNELCKMNVIGYCL
jgi:hypothetical protein